MKIFKNFRNYALIFALVFLGCAKKDPITGEIERMEPNVEKRAELERNKTGGIFGNVLGQGNRGTTFEFASSNILWRSTLKTLNFLPLLNADYSGGIIVYDWYSDDNNSNDQIKISIRFLNNEVRSESLEIIAHKKTCSKDERCSTKRLGDNFTSEIKNNILVEARKSKIEELKKKTN